MSEHDWGAYGCNNCGLGRAAFRLTRKACPSSLAKGSAAAIATPVNDTAGEGWVSMGDLYERARRTWQLWTAEQRKARAEGATAAPGFGTPTPEPPARPFGEWLVYDETLNNPPGFWGPDNPPAKPSSKPAEHVPEIGRAIGQLNRAPTLHGAFRWMAGPTGGSGA